MPCCGGCCSSQASDPEVPRCEVNLEEAGEYSLKLAVRLPRYGFFPPSQWRRGEGVQLSVVTLGGPDCDIKGPKKDLITCRCGGKVVHQVNELLPDTRYTVEVSIVDDAMPLKSASSSLEVRTAPAKTCQFAEEDWGQGFKKLEGAEADAKKGDKDRSAPSRITSPRSETERGRSHAGPSMTPEQPAVPRSVSGADDSTIAPSDVDGADLQERNEEWDFSAEEVCRERVVEDDAQVEEIYEHGTSDWPKFQSNLRSEPAPAELTVWHGPSVESDLRWDVLMLLAQEALERRALGIFLEALGASKGTVDLRDFRQSCFSGNRTLYISGASSDVWRPAGRTSERAEARVEPGCPLCQVASHAILDSWEVCQGEKSWKACVCHAHSMSANALTHLPDAGDDNAFPAEVIFATQHTVVPGLRAVSMAAVLHLAQVRGLGALRRGEGDVKQISYTMMYSGAVASPHPHMLVEAKKSLCLQRLDFV
eukprot:s58_g49.t2